MHSLSLKFIKSLVPCQSGMDVFNKKLGYPENKIRITKAKCKLFLGSVVHIGETNFESLVLAKWLLAGIMDLYRVDEKFKRFYAELVDIAHDAGSYRMLSEATDCLYNALKSFDLKNAKKKY